MKDSEASNQGENPEPKETHEEGGEAYWGTESQEVTKKRHFDDAASCQGSSRSGGESSSSVSMYNVNMDYVSTVQAKSINSQNSSFEASHLDRTKTGGKSANGAL